MNTVTHDMLLLRGCFTCQDCFSATECPFEVFLGDIVCFSPITSSEIKTLDESFSDFSRVRLFDFLRQIVLSR